MDVILSDLPEAEDIARKNLQAAQLAKGSKLSFQTLDWEKELPEELHNLSDGSQYMQFDLVVAADCTYNPDSR